jgi:rSAM/selenodomain-associated transferase 1
MSRRQLLVIAKAPVPGHTKTRLTPPCSPRQAAAIAAAALGDTLDAARRVPGARVVVVLDGATDGLDLAGCAVVPQVKGDLGTRLAAAFTDAQAGGGIPTLLLGMDTPQVSPALLTRCLDRLEAAGPGTAVLGPSTDGGWWALGLHAAAPARALARVPMSRTDTGARTRAALEDTGLAVTDLPVLTDIDHFPDALAVADRCAAFSRTARTVHRVARALERAA